MRFDAERALSEAEEFAFPRLVRSEGERRAADLLAAKLVAAGLAAERRDAARPRVPGLPVLAGLVAWLWLVVGRALPEVGAFGRFELVAIGMALLVSAVVRLADAVRRQGLDGRPQQVLAAGRGDADAPARVVFVTRLYTLGAPAVIRLHWALLLLVLASGASLLTPWARDLIRSTRWVGPALLAVHWGGLVLMFAAPKGTPRAPGPGDNRTGLAALAELARAWPKGAAGRVEARFAATSARGDLARIIAREWPAKPTLVIILESPGHGDGLLLEARGAARPLAKSAAEALWIPHSAPARPFAPSPTAAYTREGLPAIRLRGDGSADQLGAAGLTAAAQLASELALRWGRQCERVHTSKNSSLANPEG